ncbi:MAG: ParB/RepB/Spo0J family partition protein [Proteobacteria bacterium]|nr:ParB/RepB/Spo0J family partition protein [Pseudomonadota bacterium]
MSQTRIDARTESAELLISDDTGRVELDTKLIDPNPDQPRREFDQASLRRLADSIGQHGVLQPIVVRRAGSRFELIMGERRFRASQLANRLTVPAVIADVAPADRLELAIIENVQRQDLNPIELAHAYQRLADVGHTQAEIGQKVAMERSSVANHLRLLDLSRAIQADVESGKLSLGHAKALLQVTDIEAREGLRARILNQGLAVRAAERAAREINGADRRAPRIPKSTKAPVAPLDPDTRAYVERIERHLQTKVTLHPTAEGGGRLEVRFFNLEDLERIGGLLLGELR